MLKCEICNKEFNKKTQLCGHKSWHSKRNGTDTIQLLERNKNKKEQNKIEYYKQPFTCKQCNEVIPFEKSNYKRAELKKGACFTFCSKSCAATYNNTHKTTGTRISKLEKWIAERLNPLFPSLEIHYNRKDAINSELDIYIPSLKLAFELNGIFHYEPIFSEEKLKSIKNNDQRKMQACLERGIELCIIDTSKQTYVKESTSRIYLDIVCDIIKLKLLD